MPSQSRDEGYLLQVIELHPAQEILWTDFFLVVTPRIARSLHCRFCRSDGSGAQIPLAWRCKLILSRWWEMSGRWGCAGTHWIGPMRRHGVLWGRRVHSRHLKISSFQRRRRMVPPQSSPFPLWLLSLVIYRTGQYSTSFTPNYWIGLQSARGYSACLVDPTGTSNTEAEFCPDTHETHGTWVFSGLLKHIESRPNSIDMVQYDSYNRKFTIWSTRWWLIFWRIVSTRTSATIKSGPTTLELHISIVPVEHRTNSATHYKEST